MNHNQRYGWVQSRLIRWGEWRRSGVIGLGYPTMTAEARLLHSPGRSTKPDAGPEYRSDQQSADLEQVIARMAPNQQLALWCRYVQECRPGRAVIICGAEDRRDYYRMLERAERELAGLIRACA